MVMQWVAVVCHAYDSELLDRSLVKVVSALGSLAHCQAIAYNIAFNDPGKDAVVDAQLKKSLLERVKITDY